MNSDRSRASDGGNGHPLPRPDVEILLSNTPQEEMTPAAVKGMLMNPIYAGLGPYPPLVSDDQWIAACKKLLEDDSPEQFLVNLLFILREMFGTHEDYRHRE